jgi:hypothetical protein
MQNATKHLHEEKSENNKDTDILLDFSACMYEYEDIAEFEQKFELMRKKMMKQSWLGSIYKLKEKWVECYEGCLHTRNEENIIEREFQQ